MQYQGPTSFPNEISKEMSKIVHPSAVRRPSIHPPVRGLGYLGNVVIHWGHN